MVASFTRQTVVTDTESMFLAGLSALRVRQVAGRVFIYAASEFEGGLNSFEMLADGSIVPIQSIAGELLTSTDLTVDLNMFANAGGTYLLPAGRYANGATTYQLLDDGRFGTHKLSGAGLPNYGHFSTSDSLLLGGKTFVYAARWNASGLQWFEAGSDGSLLRKGGVADTTTTYLKNVSDIETASFFGKNFLFTAADLEPGIQCYVIDATGKPVFADKSNPSEGEGYSLPSVLESVKIYGRAFVVMGSFGSDTLNVYSVSNLGMLAPVDQLTDTRDTRFGQIEALEKFYFAGRTFLLAGGGDDGLTLLQLSPYGKLSVLATLADDFTATLNNVSSIQVSILPGNIRVIVGSAGDGGFTSFRLNLGALGPVLRGSDLVDILTGTEKDNDIYGNAGNDILSGALGNDRLNDGAGIDKLTGGPGNDIFQFADDGKTDTIMDFELGIDRIDFSEYSLLHHFSELNIQTRTYGYAIGFGDDLISVHVVAAAMTEPFAFGQKDFVFG